MSKGTPYNLFDAIENGIEEHTNRMLNGDVGVEAEAIYIRRHVKDFLAQKFQAAKFLAHQNNFSTEQDLQLLFDACTMTCPPQVIKETNND